MATVRQIVKDALVWRGVTDPAEEPDDADAKAGLRALINIYRQDVVGKVRLKPVSVSAAYTAGENEEISDISDSSVPITLPDTITAEDPIVRADGTTSTVRTPRDRSVVLIVGSTPALYIYDKAQADWIDILTLTLTSEAPLSIHYYDGLVARLAVMVRYPGLPIDPVAIEGSNAFRSAMTGRWDVEREPAAHEYF